MECWGLADTLLNGGSAETLEDSRLLLQPSQVSDNLRHVVTRDALDPLHAAKSPMVCGYAELHRTIEGDVGVVARLVYAMHQGRAHIGAARRSAVTPCTVPIEQRLARLECRGRRRWWRQLRDLVFGQTTEQRCCEYCTSYGY